MEGEKSPSNEKNDAAQRFVESVRSFVFRATSLHGGMGWKRMVMGYKKV